jgi:hypothetical protein
MKLKRSTLILVFMALGLIGGFLYYEKEIVPIREAKAEKQKQLFSFNEELIESFTITTDRAVLHFERGTNSEQEQMLDRTPWLMTVVENKTETATQTPKTEVSSSSEKATETEESTETAISENNPSPESGSMETASDPNSETVTETTAETAPTATESCEPTDSNVDLGICEVPESEEADTKTEENGQETKASEKASEAIVANDAYISFFFDNVIKGQQERAIAATTQLLKDYGLDNPQATVEIVLKNGQTHKLLLGDRDFTGSFIYAQLDPEITVSAEQQVFLVSTNFENAIDRPIEEWKQPPESEPETGDTPAPDSTETQNEAEGETENNSQNNIQENPEGETPADSIQPEANPGENPPETTEQIPPTQNEGTESEALETENQRNSDSP